MNNDTPADAITQADRDAAADYMGKMREPIWAAQCRAGNEHLHGPTSELVQAFARHRTTSLAAQDGLVDALRKFMPTNINLDNKNVSDKAVIPLDVTMGELRAIAAALTSIEVKSS